MIAAFLGLRLYAVLGRRAEHGEEPAPNRFEAPPVGAPPAIAPAPNRAGERAAAGVPPRGRELPPLLPAVERGLREISAADRRFDPAGFVEGARGAYRMILEAFWRGDRDELSHLCEPSVARHFEEAIAARLASGDVIDNRLVRITEAAVTEASYAAPTARIAVRFVADVAAVTRNAEGVVIAGSLDDAVEVRDVWTFTRKVNAADPDWLLDETDEG